MAKFRKKPVVIEAVQWFPGVKIDGVKEATDLDSPECLGWATIPTLEGVMTVSPGDWVITGVKGEKYPCKPDIFEATYEPVNHDPWPFPWPKPISHYDSDGPRGGPGDKPTQIDIGGVRFLVHPTGDEGCDTGRHRYKVQCLECTKILHENTTGPSTRILAHMREAHPGVKFD